MTEAEEALQIAAVNLQRKAEENAKLRRQLHKLYQKSKVTFKVAGQAVEVSQPRPFTTKYDQA